MTLFDRAMITGGLLVAFTLGLLGAAHAKGKKKKKGGTPAPAASGGAQRIRVDGVREPSGIVFHPRLQRLFVVGDEGTVAELDVDGKTIRADPVAGNLEDLAFHDPSGALVLLVENQASLVVYDPVAHKERKRVALDTEALLGRAPGKKGQGFEGLAFRPEPGRAGGGVFYLAHQRSPAMIVGIAVDLDRAIKIGKDAVVSRWPLDRYQHLTAISYEPSLGRFLLIADGRLVVLGTDGATESEMALPAVQPEGTCLDGAGALWIVDDPAGLLRFAGGAEALRGG